MKQRTREHLHTRLAKPKPAVRSTQPSSTPSKCQWRWEKLISNGNTKLWAILIFLTGVSYFLYNFVLNANMHCWPCICRWRWGWRRWRQPGWCWLSTLLVSLEGIQMRFSSPIASTTASSSSTSLSSASAIVISIGKGGVAAIKRWSSSVSWKREPGKETEVKKILYTSDRFEVRAKGRELGKAKRQHRASYFWGQLSVELFGEKKVFILQVWSVSTVAPWGVFQAAQKVDSTGCLKQLFCAIFSTWYFLLQFAAVFYITQMYECNNARWALRWWLCQLIWQSSIFAGT